MNDRALRAAVAPLLCLPLPSILRRFPAVDPERVTETYDDLRCEGFTDVYLPERAFEELHVLAA